ncbi:hypothetical protein ES332_A04G078300v1 [Gossypium tomentosum]|uniref:Uncharacterized protein n=1 Tax=Gossypium tomentosum TaxID=34277 RepID=A0A5D2QVH0_GOSTO|nr:hypothetical protein ES332_A04G078300v1 [Gossypium tomentosum]
MKNIFLSPHTPEAQRRIINMACSKYHHHRNKTVETSPNSNKNLLSLRAKRIKVG